MTQPTAFEQLLVEQINRARINPLGEFDALIANAASRTGVTAEVTAALRYFKVEMTMLRQQIADLDPAAPLAWHNGLGQVAEGHSNLMIALDRQGHNLPGEGSMGDRYDGAGYTGSFKRGENAFAYSKDPLHTHAGFFIDWGNGPGGMQTPAGHRHAIMNPGYDELGVAAVAETRSGTAVGPWVVTQNFGARGNYAEQLLGVVIRDGDGDRFYDMGEGMGGVQVAIRGAAGSFFTESWTAGGYQVALVPGSYVVTFSGGGLAGSISRSVTFGTENLKLDAMAGDARVVTVKPPVTGSTQANTLAGTAGDDVIHGMGGADVIAGGAGHDRIIGEAPHAAFDPATAIIYQLARTILDRAPTVAELVSWTAPLAAGRSDAAGVAATIMAGAAGKAALAGVTTNDAFVARLFGNVFDRAPDATMQAAWTSLLAFGETRAEVAAAMAQSIDFAQRSEAGALGMSRAGIQGEWQDDVFRVYQATLDRAPDWAGFTTWTQSLANGQTVLGAITGFTTSREFLARYGSTTDAEFVTLLFNNVLGRPPSTAGLADWAGQLSKGTMTRAQVVESLAQSAEFVRNSAADLLAWMRKTGLDDRIDGDSGRNVMLGGIGADTFVFDRSDAGSHHVADLDRWDILDMNGFGYTTATQPLARMTQVGADVVFSDQGVAIRFADTSLSMIAADMFSL